MIHFQKGGDWQRGPSRNYRCPIGWGVQWEHLPLWEEDIEGLPDRWRQIVEMKVRWGWTGTMLSLLDEPKAHCVKEGLWKW